MLRIDWNILFNIINILILYFLLKRFLFKPISNILAKRQEEADSKLSEANEKEAKAQESITKYEALLADAESEKTKLVADAKQQATGEYSRIVEEAKQKADDIVEKAKSDAEKEKTAILQQADTQIKDMVLTAAAKMVAKTESAASDSALYDKFIEAAKKQEA